MPTDACPACNGTRFIWPEERRAARCGTCFGTGLPPEQALAEYLRLSGFGRDEIRSALEPWDATYQPRPADIGWGAQVATAPGDTPRSLVLLGEPGTGKTKAACMAALTYIDAGGRNLYFANSPIAVEAVLDERREHNHSRIEGRMGKANLLILDEVGGESKGFKADMVDRWVLEWHRRETFLIVTSNATDLDQIGDGRVASRLAGGLVTLLESPVDYREIRAGQAQRRGAA